jgi:membrane-associated phospholipid phosphatase
MSVIAIIVSLLFNGRAQQAPFALNASTEAWITGVSLPASGLGLLLDKRMKPLTQEEINQLNASDINGLDRFVTNNFSLQVAKRSDVVLWSTMGLGFASSFIAPALYNTSNTYGNQVGTIGVMWFETNLVNFAITELAKTTFKRSRPFLYGGQAPNEMLFDTDSRKSFFSGHASFTATNSFFVASVLTSYQKGNKWNPVVWGAASLPPLLVSIQRMRAGKHFPTDVLTGYIIGAACGILIPKLHEVKQQDLGTVKVGAAVSPDGISIPMLSFKMVL